MSGKIFSHLPFSLQSDIFHEGENPLNVILSSCILAVNNKKNHVC